MCSHVNLNDEDRSYLTDRITQKTMTQDGPNNNRLLLDVYGTNDLLPFLGHKKCELSHQKKYFFSQEM